MNLKEIKELIEMIRGTEVSEIELEREGSRIRIRLGKDQRFEHVQGIGSSRPHADEVTVTPARIHEEVASELAIPEIVPGQVVVTSPMVGTFYRSPTPDSPPFVEAGNIVEKGQTLCIIEAMKLMNEIEAESRGRLLKVLKEDKDPVEYGEPLLIMDPLSGE